MKQLTITELFAGVLSLLISVSALAAVPEFGTVVEGEGIPEVDLGATREQVEAAYDEPTRCQNVQSPGDAASCTWVLPDYIGQGGGVQSQVTVNFRGPDGGNPDNRPEDIVSSASWYGIDGWFTTTGVNALFALNNRDAVIALYPDAVLVDQSLFSTYLTAYEEGFSVTWHTEYLTGHTTVRMSIFEPRDPPPPREPFVRISEINMGLDKRQVLGLVRVKNDLNWNISGAEVYGTWTLPNGTARFVSGTTDSFGLIQFVIDKARKGSYTLTIDDVVYEDYPFNTEDSVLSATVVKSR